MPINQEKNNKSYVGRFSRISAVVDITSEPCFLLTAVKAGFSTLSCRDWYSELISWGFREGAGLGGTLPKSFHPGGLSSFTLLEKRLLKTNIKKKNKGMQNTWKFL